LIIPVLDVAAQIGVGGLSEVVEERVERVLGLAVPLAEVADGVTDGPIGAVAGHVERVEPVVREVSRESLPVVAVEKTPQPLTH